MQSTATIHLDGITYIVDYEWTPAAPGGLFEPPEPESFEITGVYDDDADTQLSEADVAKLTRQVVKALKAL